MAKDGKIKNDFQVQIKSRAQRKARSKDKVMGVTVKSFIKTLESQGWSNGLLSSQTNSLLRLMYVWLKASPANSEDPRSSKSFVTQASQLSLS